MTGRAATLLFLFAAAAFARADAAWRETLGRELPLLGHRNWIAVVDAAYPLQAAPGVETIATGEDMPSVLEAVLRMLKACPHVRPVAVRDAELARVPEAFAPGIGLRRDRLSRLLAPLPGETLPHADLLARLDADARTYRVVVLKTTAALPYSSVFLRLECGYWSPQAEAALRRAMEDKTIQ